MVRDGLLTQQNQRRRASYKIAQNSPQSGININIHEQSSPQLRPDFSQLATSFLQLDPLTELEATSSVFLAIAEPARKNKKLPVEQLRRILQQLCVGQWLSATEIARLVDPDAEKLQSRFLTAMVKEGTLELRHPDVRNRPDQAYRTTHSHPLLK